ncbi:MAG TPA: beta-ketoacyl synthase [Micromonosporaceae bacterium]|nr:beta-ketoacyl synthase [Micromonosporaceae bacterium]
MKRVAVTGWSVHLPGVDEACAPEQASTLLGRKGLLMKEPATRLALCAVHRALKMGVGERVDGPVRTDTAVVASSNLGNVETVVDVVRTVTADGGKAVSPMVAPNASSNVLSGTVAMWFKLGGPNLMLCSGRESGLHALRLGALLLRSGRASRVVVVGAEPDDPVATGIHAQGGSNVPLRAGAACVILEQSDEGLSLESLKSSPLSGTGDCYGAQGILEIALAAESMHLGRAA